MITSSPQYVLGSDPAELARLDHQAAVIAAPTVVLLRRAGIRPGMRVLDLGSGLGHVSFALAEIVGPEGRVTGIDRDPVLLAEAERRRRDGGLAHVAFVAGDVDEYVPEERVDAIVGRLILFHLPDPAGALRHHRERSLRPGGLAVAVDYDIGAARTEPEVPVARAAFDWITQAFRGAGANPVVGARLGVLLRDAGFDARDGLGLHTYLEPGDPRGPAMLAGVVNTLRPRILADGLASEAELDGFHARLTAEVEAADAVVLPPTVCGAWGRAAGG